jgi:hypothetical protein
MYVFHIKPWVSVDKLDVNLMWDSCMEGWSNFVKRVSKLRPLCFAKIPAINICNGLAQVGEVRVKERTF